VAKHGPIKVTPFELVYEHEVVLHMEVNLQASRIIHHDGLFGEEYNVKMMDEIDDVLKNCLIALQEIEKEKSKVAKAYNKRVHKKSFQISDMIWKTILPLETRSAKFSKWSLSLEGPYKVVKIVPGNTYFVETLEGKLLPKALNEKYLKKYYPSVWQGA
jgi:hypothetical protein